MVRIVTWNVLAQPLIEPCNGRIHTFEERCTRIEAMLRELGGDVVFLQEVTPRHWKQLRRAFSETYALGRLACHDQTDWPDWARSTDYGNVTLVRRATGRLLRCNAEYWHSSGTAYDTCTVSVADRTIRTINIHLDSERHKLRQKELRQCIRATRDDTGPVLIAGDLNTDSSSTHRLLKSAGFRCMSSPDQITHSIDDKTIDWIYTRGLPTPSIRASTISVSLYQCGSDHYPVLTDLGGL